MLYALHFLKPLILTIAIIPFTGMLWSKCVAQERTEKEKAFYPHHLLGFVVSHAQVFDGKDANGKNKILFLPSLGFDYTYSFHPKWAIGLHTDIIIETFEVEGEGGATIERSRPVAPALMGIYKASDHWSFLLGIGAEFAKEENFGLTRASIEYGSELPKEWEVFGTFSFDFKWNAYDTWGFGIGIAKKLGKKKHHKK